MSACARAIVLSYLILLAVVEISTAVITDPIALHQLVTIQAGQDAVIRLKSYDTSGSTVFTYYFFLLNSLMSPPSLKKLARLFFLILNLCSTAAV